ncbi:cyclic pyranopterin monophosphate synthase MoaC, partial [Mycobacterium alsense]
MAKASEAAKPPATWASPESRSGKLSHLDERGAAHMVDVTEKGATKRTAVAAGALRTSPEVVALISSGGLPKGDA